GGGGGGGGERSGRGGGRYVHGQGDDNAPAGLLDGGGEVPAAGQREQAALAEPAAVGRLGQLEGGRGEGGVGGRGAGQLDPVDGEPAAGVEVGDRGREPVGPGRARGDRQRDFDRGRPVAAGGLEDRRPGRRPGPGRRPRAGRDPGGELAEQGRRGQHGRGPAELGADAAPPPGGRPPPGPPPRP